MTQGKKQLLLKDLCARLPYDMWVEYEGKEWLVTGYGHGRVSLLLSVFSSVGGPCPLVEEVRPYLRPMSSMTDEELMEFGRLKYQDDENWEIVEMWVVKHDFLNIKRRNKHNDSTWVSQMSKAEPLRNWKGIDWLNAHHFDYRGLIPMGLALEAPEGMYKTE